MWKTCCSPSDCITRSKGGYRVTPTERYGSKTSPILFVRTAEVSISYGRELSDRPVSMLISAKG